jgi:hypothetical protein
MVGAMKLRRTLRQAQGRLWGTLETNAGILRCAQNDDVGLVRRWMGDGLTERNPTIGAGRHAPIMGHPILLPVEDP